MNPDAVPQDAPAPPPQAAVLGRLAELAAPYVLPDSWSWLPLDPDCRRLADPAAAFARLAAEFPADEILAAGVACRAGEQVVMAPRLAAPEPGLIVMRDVDGQPIEIMTAAGCLGGGNPVLEFHRDVAAQRALRDFDDPLAFGTFNLGDAVLLRSLGLAAAPVVGLERLLLPGLKQLAQLTLEPPWNETPEEDDRLEESEPAEGATEQGDRAPTGTPDPCASFRLILVAGSLSALSGETPAALSALAQHLAPAERFLGLAWRRIHVWCPTEPELGAIAYHGTIRAGEALRGFLAALRPTGQLRDFQRPGKDSPKAPNPAERYFELSACLEGGRTDRFGLQRSRLDRAEAQSEFLALVDKFFVRPFIERAVACPDPLEAALCMALATHVQLYHRMVPAVNAIQIAEAGYREKGELIPPAVFTQWHRLGERLLRVIAQYATFRKHPRGRTA